MAKVRSNQVFQFLGVTNGFYAVVNLFYLHLRAGFCVDDLYHAFQLHGEKNGAGCAMRRRKISTRVATLWAMFAGVFGILASAWILFHRYHQHKSYCTRTAHEPHISEVLDHQLCLLKASKEKRFQNQLYVYIRIDYEP